MVAKKLIAQGAEAKIYLEKNIIIKERFQKNYRISDIDARLRKSRTKREAKVIEKLSSLGFVPKLIEFDDKLMKLKIEKISGKKVRDILDAKPSLAKEIGKNLAKMHDAGIIHQDLTTSNMIYDGKKIFFIDFGLSFFSDKLEDKAVDIHLFKQALSSAHFSVEKKAYDFFLKGYELSKNYDATLSRLIIVEGRGRYKKKGQH